MDFLYVVITQPSVKIQRCPVIDMVNLADRLPDEPSRMVPPSRATVELDGKRYDVTMGADAAEDFVTAFRLALHTIHLQLVKTNSKLIDIAERIEHSAVLPSMIDEAVFSYLMAAGDISDMLKEHLTQQGHNNEN